MMRKVYDEDLTAGGRLGIFLDSEFRIYCFMQGYPPRVQGQSSQNPKSERGAQTLCIDSLVIAIAFKLHNDVTNEAIFSFAPGHTRAVVGSGFTVSPCLLKS